MKSDIIRAIATTKIDPSYLIAELKRIRPKIVHDYKAPDDNWKLKGDDWDRAQQERLKKSNGYTRYGASIAEAIRLRMNTSVYADTALIVQDKGYATARKMLPEALTKIKSKRITTIKLLCDLINDPDITPHVISALARAKAIEALPLIQPYTGSPIPLVKREAQKAIKKLEKLRDKQAKPAKPAALTEAASGPPDDLIESSMNFDAEQIPKFLRKAFKQLQKVDRRVASEVRDVLLTMEIDEERAFTFDVTHNDEASTVHLHLFMDDEDAADLALYAEPAIAAIINQVMDADMM
ncbi:MAG: hypothetical protein AAF772_07515 [Acidobacteriota bacterium]